MKVFIFICSFIPCILIGQSEQSKRIEGTNISLMLPENFEPSENFKGFTLNDDPYTMIMVVEIPGPYYEIKKGFSKRTMKERGMELKKMKKIFIDDYEGLSIELDQTANGVYYSKAIVIYGDDEKTTIVNGMCLRENKKIYPSLYKAVNSIVIEENISVDPRSVLDFTMEESLIELQFIGVVGNGMLFNRDGNIPTNSEDKLNIFIDKSFSSFAIEDRETFSLERLGAYDDPFEFDKEKGIENIIVDQLDGISLYARNSEMKGELMRQVLLFPKEGGYYIFNATYKDGYEDTEKDIDLFLNSFLLK